MSELPSIGDTPVSTLLGGAVHRTTPDATLYEVAALLTRDDIGALVVDDDDQEATAVITERDVVRALAELADPSEVRVHQVASTNLLWCDAGSPISEVATKMAEEYVRHVLVEDDGDLVGIISARDLLGAYAAHDAALNITDDSP